MALLKQKIYKGQSYEYWAWVIYGQNKVENTSTFVISAFKDKAIREESAANEEPALREYCTYSGLYTIAECYTKFKASNAHTLVFNDGVVDEEGKIIQPATTQEVENTNWFADAEDC